MSQQKWNLKNADKDLAAQLSQEYNINPFLALILVGRGYRTHESILSFFGTEDTLLDPFLLSGMKEAVARIHAAIETGEQISVYGDFDADGVTATALLTTFLESQGAQVHSYIPSRDNEGYGLNVSAIKTLSEQGTTLLITVDNGISALEEAEFCHNVGIDLIITDHHQPGAILPSAVAIIDPHCNKGLPFQDWAGVGVAFKLVCALFEGETQELFAPFADLVAIGTIGDMVPLVGENRVLVRLGLQSINANERLGLQAFRQITHAEDKVFTASDVAFQLVPRINAAGRMFTADCALEMLMSDDYDRALLRATQLCELNTQRQATEKEIMVQIMAQLDRCPALARDKVIVLDGEDYHNGVVGIVASRMVETYGKPCIILNRLADGTAKGSCRSVEGFSVYEALCTCKEHLLRFGGHPMAAGLTVASDQIYSLRRAINTYAKSNFTTMPIRELRIDCPISVSYLSLDLVEELQVMEPFGAQNEQPVFGLFGVTLTAITPVGDGHHLRLTVCKGKHTCTVMRFGVSVAEFPFMVGDRVDIAVKLSCNEYNGKESVSVHALDVKLNCLAQDKFFTELAVFNAVEQEEDVSKEVYESVLPSRDDCARVYRLLVQYKQQGGTIQFFYNRLCETTISYGKLCVVLSAFKESGLIVIEQNQIVLQPSTAKVDLEASQAVTKIKSRMNHGNR